MRFGKTCNIVWGTAELWLSLEALLPSSVTGWSCSVKAIHWSNSIKQNLSKKSSFRDSLMRNIFRIISAWLNIPSPIRTKLDWLVAFPSWSWKVKVPSSAGVRDSMIISMTPVFLSKFILYFCKTTIKTLRNEDNPAYFYYEHKFFYCLTSPWVRALSLKM